jgi:hypothetical protein
MNDRAGDRIPRDIAAARDLVLLVDIDEAAPDGDAQAELVETLRTLRATRAYVVLISSRTKEELEDLHAQVPGALWAADHGRSRNHYDRWEQVDAPIAEARAGVAEWVRGLLPEPTFVALTDRVLLAWIAQVRLGADASVAARGEPRAS